MAIDENYLSTFKQSATYDGENQPIEIWTSADQPYGLIYRPTPAAAFPAGNKVSLVATPPSVPAPPRPVR